MASYEILSEFPSGEQRRYLALQRGFANFRKLVVARPLPPELRGDPVALRDFMREARTVGLFSHPHVADLYDVAEEGGQLYLFTEFVPGASLAEVIRACRHANLRLPLEATLRIIQHAAMGLHYAHHFVDPAGRSMGVLHRHLSTEALIIGFDGLTRVTDFCSPAGKLPLPSAFRAPEQLRGEPIDPRTDVFSLGMVLKTALMELKEHSIPTPTIKIPSALERIAQRATERPRDERFVNMAALAQECEAVAGRGWEPLQLAAFVQRLFEDRRQRTAELVGPSENFKESTARARIGHIFEEGGKGPDAQSAVEEASRPAIRSPFAASDEPDTSPETEGHPGWGSRPEADAAVRPTRLHPRRHAPPPRAGAGTWLLRALIGAVVAAIIFGAGATVVDPKWIDRAAERLQRLVRDGQ